MTDLLPRSDPRAPAASSSQVRAIMQGNRGRDTRPEVEVRRELHRRGLRFRKHARPLPDLRCHVDILFPKQRIAVFVDGCFWHGCPAHGRLPQTNAGFWSAKVGRNRTRDARNDAALFAAGWDVVRVWEHEDPVAVADRVERLVRAIGDRAETAIVRTSK
jgi:DNA mismatch endonuclease (patch repair protein)